MKDIGATEVSRSLPQVLPWEHDSAHQLLSSAGNLPTGVDFGQYVSKFIQSGPYVGPGWQRAVATTERVGKAQEL